MASQKACRQRRDQVGGYDTNDETHLPLGGEVTVTSGDTKQVGIEFRQLRGRNDGVGWFRRGMHFGQDFNWEGLWDSRSR